MLKKFIVDGEPYGKSRPRFRVVYGKHVQTYNTRANVVHEQIIKEEYIRQCGNEMFPKEKELYVLIVCFMQIPKGVSKLKRSKMCCYQIRPRKKPDWDNIGKTVCDSLNGVAYHDDCMIVDGRVKKFYSEIPRTVVYISDSFEEIQKGEENE